jgi:hypothetical protein
MKSITDTQKIENTKKFLDQIFLMKNIDQKSLINTLRLNNNIKKYKDLQQYLDKNLKEIIKIFR